MVGNHRRARIIKGSSNIFFWLSDEYSNDRYSMTGNLLRMVYRCEFSHTTLSKRRPNRFLAFGCETYIELERGSRFRDAL